jgi:hypothetical protein
MNFRTVLEAALDAAIERLCRAHPDRQVFIFGPEGSPFWAKDPVLPGELEWHARAVSVIEQHQTRHERPFVVAPLGLPVTAMALDAEGELYAVVLSTGSSTPAEVRASAERSGRTLAPLGWLEVGRR